MDRLRQGAGAAVNEKIEELFQREHDNPRIWLRVASERLSLLRYVFLVQIEDGIPDADQRPVWSMPMQS